MICSIFDFVGLMSLIQIIVVWITISILLRRVVFSHVVVIGVSMIFLFGFTTPTQATERTWVIDESRTSSSGYSFETGWTYNSEGNFLPPSYFYFSEKPYPLVILSSGEGPRVEGQSIRCWC